MSDLYTYQPSTIVLYGVSWCGDCKRARRVFAENQVNYIDIDIEKDAQAAEFVRQHNRGNQSVPTIIFPDGSALVEPDNSSLLKNIENNKPAA